MSLMQQGTNNSQHYEVCKQTTGQTYDEQKGQTNEYTDELSD